MGRLLHSARRFLAAEDGPTMAEWALMVMLIALACLTGVSLLGTNLRDFYNSVAGMI